uniref:Transposase n=1 Tax=Anopheles arabiensis TaxID=7173 RepID=A0A182HYC2_ANOAR
NPHTIPEQEQIDRVDEHQRINELYERNDSKSASDFVDHEASVLISDQEKIQNLEAVIATLTEEIDFCRKLRKDNSFLLKQKKILLQQNKKLKLRNTVLKNRIRVLEQTTIQHHEIVPLMKKKLSKTLSGNQIDLILKRKKRVRWTKKELGAALTLRYFGKRPYMYMTDDMHFPLPARATIQRYIKSINIKQGILADVLNLMESYAKTLTPRDRECVISFDEMKVTHILEYDVGADEVLGPHNYLQVVMARGIFNKWKQPIFIGFDQKMTKDIILSLIKKLSERMINVVAIVSDNCQAHASCLRDLGAHDITKPYFNHPVTNKNVYVFPDAPHLIKLLRNWLIDTGFDYKGSIITADPLRKLVEERKDAEITPLFKLNENHLTMSPQERQNVRRAVQLLSHTTATALRRYQSDDASQTLAEFIETVDCWFSISNSYSPWAKIAYKRSYTGKEEQEKSLDKMYELISNMTALNKTSMQTFQKSILMHITSLKMLYKDMQKKHQVDFISTHKLNQDILENFFSQLRQKGGVYDHPSPLSCLHRIRMIVIGKSPTILINQTNLETNRNTRLGENICLMEQHENANEDCLSEQNQDFMSVTLFTEADVIPDLPDNALNAHEMDDESEILSTISSTIPDLPEQDSDGFEYIVGYLGKKFHKKHPHIDQGTYSFKITSDHNYSKPPSFVKHLSTGGLFVPSHSFLKLGSKMEKIFQKLHPDGTLDKKPGIVKT